MQPMTCRRTAPTLTMLCVWLVSQALCAVLSSPAHADPEVEYRVDAPATLFWLLSALSGDPFVDGHAWTRWWQEQGLQLPEDATQIAAFGRLRATYRGRLLEPKVRDNPWVPVPPPPSYRLDVRFSAMFLGARDVADLSRRAEVLLVEADQAILQGVVASFAPRVDKLQARQPWLAQFRNRFEEFAAESRLPAFLSGWATTLGAPAGGRVRVHFVPSPPTGASHGRRLGQDLIVEVRQGDTPARRSDVVIHEGIHWLQERASLDDDPALVDALYRTGSASAARAWELLSEGLATAIGQGIWLARVDAAEFQRTLRQPGGWYVDSAIDPFAKAIYPALQRQPSQRLETLAPALVQAAEALPPPTRASELLHRYILISNHRDAPWMQAAWFRHVAPRAVWRADLDELAKWLGTCKGTTVVVAATWAELAALQRTDRKALGVVEPAKAAQRRAALLVRARDGGARLLVVAAPDETALADAMQALATGPVPALTP